MCIVETVADDVYLAFLVDLLLEVAGEMCLVGEFAGRQTVAPYGLKVLNKHLLPCPVGCFCERTALV